MNVSQIFLIIFLHNIVIQVEKRSSTTLPRDVTLYYIPVCGPINQRSHQGDKLVLHQLLMNNLSSYPES